MRKILLLVVLVGLVGLVFSGCASHLDQMVVKQNQLQLQACSPRSVKIYVENRLVKAKVRTWLGTPCVDAPVYGVDAKGTMIIPFLRERLQNVCFVESPDKAEIKVFLVKLDKKLLLGARDRLTIKYKVECNGKSKVFTSQKTKVKWVCASLTDKALAKECLTDIAEQIANWLQQQKIQIVKNK